MYDLHFLLCEPISRRIQKMKSKCDMIIRVANGLIMSKAHMTIPSFIIKVNMLIHAREVIRSLPQPCWLLTLEWPSNYENIIQSLLNTSPFQCLLLCTQSNHVQLNFRCSIKSIVWVGPIHLIAKYHGDWNWFHLFIYVWFHGLSSVM